MYVYELVRCELDEQNHIRREEIIGFFSKPEYIIDYLTQDGESSCTLSILGHNDYDNQHINEYIGSPNATLVVKYVNEGIPLLGMPPSEDKDYYYTRKHEVRDYGFFSPRQHG